MAGRKSSAKKEAEQVIEDSVSKISTVNIALAPVTEFTLPASMASKSQLKAKSKASSVRITPKATTKKVTQKSAMVSTDSLASVFPAVPQFYCALSLPLGNMGYQARVAGLALLVPTKGDNVESVQGLSKAQRMVLKDTGQAQLLPCQLSPHTQLSPRFLWKQGIDPYNLQHGLGVAEFLDVSSFCLQPASEQDVLVSFGLRHFVACNTMALQNYMRPNFLTRFNYIVDVKIALLTCAYFGQQRKLWRLVPQQIWGNLAQAAAALGFEFSDSNRLDESAASRASEYAIAASTSINTDVAPTALAGREAFDAKLSSKSVNVSAHLQQRQKVTALSYIYRYLWQLEPKIMSFLQRSWIQRFNFITQHQYMVSLDAKDKLCVLSVLAYDLKLRLVKAISCNGSELQLMVINLDTAPLLAPISILTPERQQELNFDLTAVMSKLSQVDLAQLGLDSWPISSDSNAEIASSASADDTKPSEVTCSNVFTPVKDEQVPLTECMQNELYKILACLSGGDGESHESAYSSNAQVDYAYEAAVILAEVPPSQGVVAQAVGVFTVKELPFYHRYWLTMAAGHFAQWWQLAQLLESVQLSRKVQNSHASNSSEMNLRLWSLLQPQTQEASAWSLQALGYAYDNLRSLLDDGLLQRYSRYVVQLEQKRSKTWQQELNLLYNNLQKDDLYGAHLLIKIAAFLGMASQ